MLRGLLELPKEDVRVPEVRVRAPFSAPVTKLASYLQPFLNGRSLNRGPFLCPFLGNLGPQNQADLGRNSIMENLPKKYSAFSNYGSTALVLYTDLIENNKIS